MILAYALEFACICWVGFDPENPGLVLHWDGVSSVRLHAAGQRYVHMYYVYY